MIHPPIILDASGDLVVFSSLAAMLRELTPAEVREGRFRAAYDAEGRRLRIEVKVQERKILGLFRQVKEWVVVESMEHIPTHEQTLREFLLRFIHPPHAAPSDPGPPVEGILRFSPGARG